MSIYKSEAGKQAVEALYRKALQRWPVPRREITVPTSQGNTFVVVSGDAQAPPVVLLHGSGTNSAVWMRDVAEWSTRCCVYAVDIIGEPGFSAPSRPSLRSDAYAVWLDDVWNHFGLDRASVVGVSLGGWMALDYAIRRPARVRSLSLVSPSGIGRQNPWFLLKAGLLLRLGKRGLRKSFSLTAGKTNVPSEVADFVTLIFRHFRSRMEKLPIRTDAELTSLTMPVQLIVGGKDALIRSNETRERMERLLPQLQLTYLENEGHLLPKQTSTIGAFLSAQAAASTAGHRTDDEERFESGGNLLGQRRVG